MSPSKKDRKISVQFRKTIFRERRRATGGRGFRRRDIRSSAPRVRRERQRGEVHRGLDGANERAAKNWYNGRNGPSGEFLVLLCRHSDQVLETVLMLCGRSDLLAAKKLVDAKSKLQEMLTLIDQIQTGGSRTP